LDPATEAAICETLRKLRGKVTVLAISHQSAMMEAADLVYRLEGGKLEIIKEGVEADAAITA
jgi:ATP-binding cassette subfamily C protein